ncbi:MAG TPA: WD40 repeat domain-containing protein [Pyrinomonadaceae bacterium]|nr:WD40 repeat domain-containing protein [Pyrinomonadaceae bacterium]
MGNDRLADQTAPRQEIWTLRGHTGWVSYVAFSPDGATLASASYDHTIKLWDAHTLTERQTLWGEAGSVFVVKFSPDGRTLASGGEDTTVRLWDATTGRQQRTLRRHEAPVSSVAFSPDGKRLASSSADRTVRLWDVATGSAERTLNGHTREVFCVDFSPDGKTLASSGMDATIRLWDAASGREERTLKGHDDGIITVAFSADGRTLASGSMDGEIKLWDAATGRCFKTLRGHTAATDTVLYSPGGEMLASGSWDRTIKLWDAKSGAELCTLKGHTDKVQSIAFSPDGQRLASGSEDLSVKLWNTREGLNLREGLKMGNTQTRQQVSSGQGAGAQTPSMPDVNAETYPYETVQHLLDQTANFSMFAVPERHSPEELLLLPDAPQDWFGMNGGYGIVIRNSLQRFESFVQTPATDDLSVAQVVGETAGSLRANWLFCSDECRWTPGQLPPPAIYDPWASQPFAMLDAVFSFGEGNHFRGYGTGRTFPLSVNGQPKLLAAAVGNVMEGAGKFRGREGTFVMTGSLTPELGFLGHISLRIYDPDGVLRSESELSGLTGIADPDPSSTFFVMRGEKKDRTVRTTFGAPPGGGRVSLITPSQFRAAQFNFTSRGGGGVRTETTVGPVVCKMDATVYFNLLAPSGTAAAPVPFSTDEVYRFVDGRGREVATLTAAVVEGISFDLKFPAAPGQKGVRFAGFGPITGGTGVLEGVQGILTVNSLIGIAPHALTLMHTLHLTDAEGRFRAGGSSIAGESGAGGGGEHRAGGGGHSAGSGESRAGGGESRESGRPAQSQLSEDDPFYPLLRHAEDYTDMYLKWRRGFRKCSQELSTTFADMFNRHLGVGDFPGLEIDPQALKGIFEHDIKPFDSDTFERYRGQAKGTFRTYELGTNREVAVADLYSHWRPETMRVNGRNAKKISGSFSGYFDPHNLPDLSEGKVDIIFNSYRGDVGLTSWVEIYQHQRQQRTSFAYKLPHRHEILWLVKDVSLGGQPIDNNVFMASHEWKGHHQGRTAYFMVAFFYDIDFDSCTARLSGDHYWRALYIEE